MKKNVWEPMIHKYLVRKPFRKSRRRRGIWNMVLPVNIWISNQFEFQSRHGKWTLYFRKDKKSQCLSIYVYGWILLETLEKLFETYGTASCICKLSRQSKQTSTCWFDCVKQVTKNLFHKMAHSGRHTVHQMQFCDERDAVIRWDIIENQSMVIFDTNSRKILTRVLN